MRDKEYVNDLLVKAETQLKLAKKELKIDEYQAAIIELDTCDGYVDKMIDTLIILRDKK